MRESPACARSRPALSINRDLDPSLQLRASPGTAHREDTSKLEGRQRRFSYAIDWPIHRWKAALWIDFLFFLFFFPARVTFECKPGINWTLTKKVLEQGCGGGGRSSEIKGQKFCQGRLAIAYFPKGPQVKGHASWTVSWTWDPTTAEDRSVSICSKWPHTIIYPL